MVKLNLLLFTPLVLYFLQISGSIVAPKNPDVWEGLDRHKWLYFIGVKNLIIEGGGIINGRGEEWWTRSCKVNMTNVLLICYLTFTTIFFSFVSSFFLSLFFLYKNYITSFNPFFWQPCRHAPTVSYVMFLEQHC